MYCYSGDSKKKLVGEDSFLEGVYNLFILFLEVFLILFLIVLGLNVLVLFKNIEYFDLCN